MFVERYPTTSLTPANFYPASPAPRIWRPAVASFTAMPSLRADLIQPGSSKQIRRMRAESEVISQMAVSGLCPDRRASEQHFRAWAFLSRWPRKSQAGFPPAHSSATISVARKQQLGGFDICSKPQNGLDPGESA